MREVWSRPEIGPLQAMMAVEAAREALMLLFIAWGHRILCVTFESAFESAFDLEFDWTHLDRINSPKEQI
jgi:hypothetical protein